MSSVGVTRGYVSGCCSIKPHWANSHPERRLYEKGNEACNTLRLAPPDFCASAHPRPQCALAQSTYTYTTGGVTRCSLQGEYRAGGRVPTRPAGLPHPWGATSCTPARQPAPLTHLE